MSHLGQQASSDANLQDLGARDPTIGEIESDFSEKALWNWDTNHLIMCAFSQLSTSL